MALAARSKARSCGKPRKVEGNLADPWPTEIRLSKDRRTLTVGFDTGESHALSAEYLRVFSPSAEVQGHSPEQRVTVGGKALESLSARLRELPRPVIGRLAEGRLWLDCRCLEPADEAAFIAQLRAADDTL